MLEVAHKVLAGAPESPTPRLNLSNGKQWHRSHISENTQKIRGPAHLFI
jgi:hypothetical protein